MVTLSFALATPKVLGQNTPTQSPDTLWTLRESRAINWSTGVWVRPTRAILVDLDVAALGGICAHAPREGAFPVRRSAAIISLPRPDGTFQRFAFVNAPILKEPLASKHPEIRTYLAQGIDSPAATARFCITPLGFHAMVLDPSDPTPGHSAWYLEPAHPGQWRQTLVYWHGDSGADWSFHCNTPTIDAPVVASLGSRGSPIEVVRNEMVIAIATTGEYTQWIAATMNPPQAPSVAIALAGIAATLQRVNLILERDGPVRLQLHGNNDQVIFFNPATDPYSGTTNNLIEQNNTTLTAYFGSQYTLGHVFDANDQGGLAAIASVCTTSRGKGACTGATMGLDAFSLRVAHETGHQLGANHSFNSNEITCGPQRWDPTAYEPGGGSTIMSYGSTCGTDSFVTIRDPMYAFKSILEMAPVVVGASCVNRVNTGNVHPGATPTTSATLYIPTNTPFRLLAPTPQFYENGEIYSYSIEQADLDFASGGPLLPDTGNHEPLFRVFPPTAGVRWFPAEDKVLAGAVSPGETLPLFSRTSAFKGVIRDNVAGAGGWGMNDISVQFVAMPGTPLDFITPTAGAAFCGGQSLDLQWQVSSTNLAPVNATTVDILMSTDGGLSFPWNLAVDVPNTGSATVTIPFVPTTQGRLKIQASGGLFYRVNNAEFSVSTAPPTLTTSPQPVSFCRGSNVVLSATTGGGSPRFYRWSKDGVPLNDSNNLFGSSTETLTISPATWSDTGEYSFEVFNGCGTVQSTSVHVQVGLQILASPDSVVPNPCDTVELNVQARGVGAISYHWLKDGTPLEDSDKYSGTHTPTITIQGVRFNSDEGLFWCAVQDQCELRTSSIASVSLPPPVWVQKATTPAPLRRNNSSTDIVFDPVRNVCVLYGGSGALGNNQTGYQDDTWEWDGIEWTRIYPVHTPGPRADHELVFDSSRNVVLLFGGVSTIHGNNSQVWAYDGNDWTMLTTSPDGPTPSIQKGDAVFDPVHNTLVTIVDASDIPSPPPDRNRTWVLDSQSLTWSMAYEGPGPHFYQSSLIFDSSLGSILAQASPGWTPERYWTWTGTGWTSPGPGTTYESQYAAAAFDSFRGFPIIFGCCRNLGQGSNDTRTFKVSGTVKQLLLPSFHTSQFDAIIPAGLAFDTRRHAMVLVGTTYNSSTGDVPMQTWEYRYLDRVVFDRVDPDKDLVEGGSATFHAFSAGYGTLSYQWRRGGVPLTDGITPWGSTHTGANTPTLTISNLATSDAGNYDCLVTNACGTSTSESVALGQICIADVDDGTATGTPDGGVTIDDLLYYIAIFNLGLTDADVDDGTGTGTLDGGVTIDDLLYYLLRFNMGC